MKKAVKNQLDMFPQLEWIPPGDLHPFEDNPRHHSARQIIDLKKSLQSLGFIAPIIIDRNNTILAGHGRRIAALELGLVSVPCVRVMSLTEEQKRIYLIADNKLAQGSKWDYELLNTHFEALKVCETVLDLDVTGFSLLQIETISDRIDIAEKNVKKTKSGEKNEGKHGDFWAIGACYLFFSEQEILFYAAGLIGQGIFIVPDDLSKFILPHFEENEFQYFYSSNTMHTKEIIRRFEYLTGKKAEQIACGFNTDNTSKRDKR